MTIVGIDLGTTNSLISFYKNGVTTLIPNEFGEVLTPSVVYMEQDNQTVHVGKTARDNMVLKPEWAASQFKRYMGMEKLFQLGTSFYTGEELSALVLRRLKEDAEAYLKEPVTEAVISVPAYFDDKQRSATKRAGEMAGFVVERIVNEPSAAALVSQINHPEQERSILIFDFGGGTLDVSYAECFDHVVNIAAISGDNQLGGIDFDRAIAEYICIQNGINFHLLRGADRNRLLQESEKLKIQLSEKEEESINVQLEGKTISVSLSRKELVSITNPIFKKIDSIIRSVFRDAEIESTDIDEVILVGGSCKMPLVQQFLKFILPGVSINEQASDTIVAKGVGMYAGIKGREEGISNMVLMDICPFSLGIGTVNQIHEEDGLRMSVIIKRNTPLPATRTERYSTIGPLQSIINIEIYQGENRYVKDNLKLGDFQVFLKAPKVERQQVEISYSYDINGILVVKVKILSTGEVIEKVFDHSEMSEEEKDFCLKRLHSLSLPYESEENKKLFDLANQIYPYLSDSQKEYVEQFEKALRIALTEKSLLKQHKARENLSNLLEYCQNEFHGASVQSFKRNWYDTKNNIIPFDRDRE